jgi:LysR family nitrogen assimilation transcriptional regulator
MYNCYSNSYEQHAMELSQLRNFISAAENGSVSRAAVVARVSQPTLSRQIRDLEAELKTSLFRRNGHGVQLTPSGHRFLAYARDVVGKADMALVAMQRDNQSYKGYIAGGMPPSLGRLATFSLVSSFSRRFPKAVLSLTEGGSGSLYDQVLSGRLDFAVMRNPPASSQVIIEQIRVESLFAVGAKPVGRRGAVVRLDDLARLPLIMPTRGESKRSLIDPAIARGEFTPNIVMEIDSVTSMFELAQAGMGYAIIPESTITVLPKTKPRLHCQRIDAPGVVAALCFVTSLKVGRTSLQGKAVRFIRDELVDLLPTYAGDVGTSRRLQHFT